MFGERNQGWRRCLVGPTIRSLPPETQRKLPATSVVSPQKGIDAAPAGMPAEMSVSQAHLRKRWRGYPHSESDLLMK